MGGGLFVDQQDSGTAHDEEFRLGLRFSIVAFNNGSEGPNLFSAGEDRIEFSYNLFYSNENAFNASGCDGARLSGEAVVDNPYLMVEDGDTHPQLPRLASVSPAIDAGPPTWRDVDGTLLDLGATGSEKAGIWAVPCEERYSGIYAETCPDLVPLGEAGGCAVMPSARPSSAGIGVLFAALGLAAVRRHAASRNRQTRSA